MPTGVNTIELYDNKTGSFAYLYLIVDPGNPPTLPPAPLLMTDQGFVIKKDLAVGGEVLVGQGMLVLNFGFVGHPELSSPPSIMMMASGEQYPSGGSLPSPQGNSDAGQMFNLTQTYNGFTPGKYMWTGSTWSKSEYFTGFYDTLFLVKSDMHTPTHLDLGDLISRGSLYFALPDGSINLQVGGLLKWGTSARLAMTNATRGFSGSTALSTQNGSGALGVHITSGLQVDHIDSATGGGIYLFDKVQATTTYPLKTQNNTLDDGSGKANFTNLIQMPGGTSSGPGLWFNSAGPSGYFGGSLGIGLNSSFAIVLNAGGGGVVTANGGNLRNTLDDGSGNLTISGSNFNINPASNPVLNLQINASTKAAFGFNGTSVYLTAYTGDLNLASTEKIIINSSATGNTGLELGNSSNSGGIPYIDFHFGRNTSEDFNIRLMNNADCMLYFQTRTSTGGFSPFNDGQYVLGDATHRWSLIRGITITSGDYRFENDWAFTEDGDDLVLKRPDGSIAQKWKTQL